MDFYLLFGIVGAAIAFVSALFMQSEYWLLFAFLGQTVGMLLGYIIDKDVEKHIEREVEKRVEERVNYFIRSSEAPQETEAVPKRKTKRQEKEETTKP